MNEDQSRTFRPVKALYFEHVLGNDPSYIDSQNAIRDLEVILNASLCSVVADSVETRDVAIARAVDGLQKWLQVFVPTGNPINDSELLPLIQSADLVFPNLDQATQNNVTEFAWKLVRSGDVFYQGNGSADPRAIKNPDTDSRTWNNWQTWRIAIRAQAGGLLRSSETLESTKLIVSKMIAQNLLDNGRSFDFLNRDALHYHVHNLKAWINIAWFTPQVLSDEQRLRIEKSVLFLKDYYTQKKQHMEFVNSKVAFDRERLNAGLPQYQHKPWQPEGAKKILRLARCLFPATQNWTNELYRGNEAAPSEKFLVSLDCES